MSTSRRSPIVVGVDGSGSSLDAVGWAARAAELRGVPLKLVSAYQVKALYTSFVALPSHIGSEEHAAAESILASAALVARRSVEDPDALPIIVEPIVGPTIQAMLEQSSSASMMVVGSRGNGEYFAELLGSVSTAVAVQAHCPVAIVPGSVEVHSSRGPVVLGVDVSAHNQNAVRLAFEEASLRGTGLVAVHVSTDELVSSPDASVTDRSDAIVSNGRTILAESMSGWSEQYPDVEVQQTVLRGNVVEKILEAASRAQAVVVGSSGRNGFSDRLLGSTVRSLAHRVDCPLIIARG
ncbi:universal stress protein [Rhodococcus sp. ARC_M12]|uniref:universal stress protein n=1 Tax=unclassified Rhodococcus (in: high G+C Gram-positive bacteria) TaxID=192944 RepID=UPI001FB3489F|nr:MULTISPECIES: universal stress protein [unclassified Rhodococcus (in: high G+C Gram-positive bacteria)]MCJ0891970.1 universal stress protein [Rhodococcus sp. ARC_M5]MCJ0980127.1 universal stress protein [Rhodococcus sp. ARC_M12]